MSKKSKKQSSSQLKKRHFSNKVVDNIENNSGDFPEVLLNDRRSCDNTLQVRIGNVKTVALLDSGATISCVSHSLLNKIQPRLLKYQKPAINKIYGVGNVVQDVSCHVQFNFHIDQHQFTNSFYAIQNNYPLILGMDFLVKNKGILNFENSTVQLNDATFNLSAPPRRSTLVKTKQAQLIDAYTSMDIPVGLPRPVESTCMLLEPVMSLSRAAPGLEIPLAVVSSQSTTCRVTNPTDTPISIPAGCVVALARNIVLNSVTEMIDFFQPVTDNIQVNTAEQAHDEGQSPDYDFNKIMPFPVSDPEDDLNFNIDNPKLSAQEIAELIAFLVKNKQAFASTLAKLGHSSEYFHKIETGDAKPVALRFYRTSPKVQQEIDNQIEDLLKYGIIEPSTSAWSSPVVMVKKSDGSYRMAIDYRQLNSRTKPQNFPVPRLPDIFDQIGDRKPQYFSTLDLQSGFWQISVSPEDKDKTAFVTKNAKYVFNRMPFGLRNGPSTFQQCISTVLRDLLGKSCCVYADDILCYSPDLKTHKSDLQKIFDRLIKAGLTLNPKKCHFAVQSVRYFGHILSPEGIRTDPSKVQVIQNYPVPKTVTEVRRFLGMTQYYRRFQKNYSNLAKPLQNLTKNNVTFEWTPSCQTSFETMIHNLTTAPILAYPDCHKAYILNCDASDVAISFILSQLNDENREVVIEYAGRTLRKSELNYSVTDKEALAVVEGFRKFHTYLYGSHTTVITDHQALEHVYKNPKITGRISRWNILLQNYDYTVQYKKGKHNTNADAISRLENLPQPDNENADDIIPENVDLFVIDPDPQDVIDREPQFHEYFVFEHMESVIPSVMPVNDIDIVTAQKQCPVIGPIYNFIESGELPEDHELKPSIIADASQYFIKNGVMYHLYQPRVRNLQKHKPLTSQIVIPKSLRPMVLSEFHDSLTAGHQGFLRTYAAIHERYYWPQMYREILDYQQTCYPCQRASNYMPRPPPLGKFPPFSEASIWSRIHMDFLGPLREGKHKEKYILLVVDAFSKWPEAFALPSCDSITVAKVLYKEIFTRYGAPSVLISDRAQTFMSNLVRALCDLFSVKRNYTSSYHACSNSACERLNSQINRALRTYVNPTQEDWPSILPGILMAFRNTPADNSTEFSPYFLMFGQQMKTPLDVAVQGNLKEVSPHFRTDLKTFLENVQLSRQIAKENMERHLEINKTRYDQKSQNKPFHVGQYVWLYNPAVPVGYSSKLHAKWCGPYTVTEVHDNNTYRIRHFQTHLESPSLINGIRLKPAKLHSESAIRTFLEQQQRQQGIPVIPDIDRRQNVNNDEADRPGQNEPDDPLPPVEKVTDLARNNRGKWFRVKFRERPGPLWVQRDSVDIPQHLIDQCLRKRTWQGTARKRKKKQ